MLSDGSAVYPRILGRSQTLTAWASPVFLPHQGPKEAHKAHLIAMYVRPDGNRPCARSSRNPQSLCGLWKRARAPPLCQARLHRMRGRKERAQTERSLLRRGA